MIKFLKIYLIIGFLIALKLFFDVFTLEKKLLKDNFEDKEVTKMLYLADIYNVFGLIKDKTRFYLLYFAFIFIILILISPILVIKTIKDFNKK